MEVHNAQLEAIGFPVELVERLFEKLGGSILDAGSAFQFGENTEDESRSEYGVYAINGLKKHSDVFLIDHVWTTTTEDAFKSLVTNDKLRAMCCQIINMDNFEESQNALDYAEDIEVDVTPKEFSGELEVELKDTFPSGKYLDLTGNALDSFPQLEEPLDEVVALNLGDNNISDLTAFIATIPQQVKDNVRALYVESNLLEDPSYNTTYQIVSQHFSKLEILNGKFTENYSEWAVLYLCDAANPKGLHSIDVSGRAITTWKTKVWEQFSDCVELNARETNIVNMAEFIDAVSKLPKLRELKVDHKFQGAIHQARAENKIRNLETVNNWYIHLPVPTLAELTATQICKKMWQYWETYKLSNQYVSLWYLMDQLGISIQHDQDQNVKMAPFYYYPTQETFTLLWPVKDIEAEEQIKRDFLHGMTHEGRRRVLESIWKDMDDDELREIERTSPELPQPKSVSNVPIDMGMFEKKNQGILKVYTDSKMVVTGLSEAADFQDVDDVQFQLVETPDQADICWYTHEHYKDYQNLVLKKQFVNQFRNEHLFTIKAELARAVKGKNLPFTIETYDLAYPRDIAQYILRFREARDNGEKNIWIVKPANLSRSMNMNVVTDEKAPLKLTETGPVIVSKYLTNPCTITGRKFDLRMYVIVTTHPRGVAETKLTTYMTDDIVIRVANNEYSLDNLHEFEKHFTVMNYRNEENPEQYKRIIMGKPAFIEQFNTEYGADRWLSVQDDIRGIVRDLFNALSSYILTETIDTYCAALYGIDIMMDDKLRPHVIEVNYGPDCRTVCKQHPGFFPDVFKCMFTSRPLSETIVELK